MDRYADTRRRRVAVALLVALLAAFGVAAPAPADPAAAPGHGAVVLAVAAPPAHGLANPPGAPEHPLADAEAPPARDEQSLTTADRTRADAGAPPRAHRQPAADRAPPA